MSPYRVRAFHTAADAVHDLPPGPGEAVQATQLRGVGPVRHCRGDPPRHRPARCRATSPACSPKPATAPGPWPAGTFGPRAAGAATRTPTGRTAAARSRTWPTPPAPWATGGLS
ncbi:hypothetical protein ACFQ6B_33480 [Streptomyces wedmorensis]|uniref:Uncharacterized protein n=1 Tax=Streptomyces wedmorensis TaxID=43759 RepID=A0ABW6J6Z7_STRWE